MAAKFVVPLLGGFTFVFCVNIGCLFGGELIAVGSFGLEGLAWRLVSLRAFSSSACSVFVFYFELGLGYATTYCKVRRRCQRCFVLDAWDVCFIAAFCVCLWLLRPGCPRDV